MNELEQKHSDTANLLQSRCARRKYNAAMPIYNNGITPVLPLAASLFGSPPKSIITIGGGAGGSCPPLADKGANGIKSPISQT